MMEGRDPEAINRAEFHWRIDYDRPTWWLGRWRATATLRRVDMPDGMPEVLTGRITLSRTGRTRDAAASAVCSACQWYADQQRDRWLKQAIPDDELVT